MPSYKLYYFTSRGRAEMCRLLFALTGQDYEDVRFAGESEEWKAFKPETLTGKLPVLEIDGRKFTQSIALAKYLAREFGLHGQNNLEALQIDEIIGILQDILTQILKAYYVDESKREEAMKEFKEKDAPIYLSALAKLLKENGTGFFVGSTVTLADIAVYDLLFNLQKGTLTPLADLGDTFPTLVEHNEKIQNLDGIREYVEKRPENQR